MRKGCEGEGRGNFLAVASNPNMMTEKLIMILNRFKSLADPAENVKISYEASLWVKS